MNPELSGACGMTVTQCIFLGASSFHFTVNVATVNIPYEVSGCVFSGILAYDFPIVESGNYLQKQTATLRQTQFGTFYCPTSPPTRSGSPKPSPTRSPPRSVSQSPLPTPSRSQSPDPSPSPFATPTPLASPGCSETPDLSRSPLPSDSPSDSPTASASPSRPFTQSLRAGRRHHLFCFVQEFVFPLVFAF
jgi:hypothetical protein